MPVQQYEYWRMSVPKRTGRTRTGCPYCIHSLSYAYIRPNFVITPASYTKLPRIEVDGGILRSHAAEVTVSYTLQGKKRLPQKFPSCRKMATRHNAAWNGTHVVSCRGLRHFHTGLTTASAWTIQKHLATTSRKTPTSTAEQKQTTQTKLNHNSHHRTAPITLPPRQVTTSNWLVGRPHPGYKSISYSRLQSNLVRPRLDVGVDVKRIYERRPKSLRLPCLVQTL